MRNLKLMLTAGVLLCAVAAPGSAAARLRAPSALGPANHVKVQELGNISWGAVRGAAAYEYQISADRRFHSLLGGTPGSGNHTHNLAASVPKLAPDGTYSWRVRAISKTGAVGAWSRTRTMVKHWTATPKILAGNGAAISWPANPLVLKWSTVPYAFKYIVTIATDPALSNVVLGTAANPVTTQGTSFVLPGTVPDGSYYWAVTPVDAEGHRGVPSGVARFTWQWPTSTSTQVTDLNPDPRVFDPFFSWSPIPGAARYDVEINASSTFPAGSKWCCAAPTIGTSLAPQRVLANNAYYWRVRGLDANGHAGQWNYGPSFTKAFDSITPSVPNLTMTSGSGTPLPGVPSTDTPIVTWDPVPGASHYEVQVASYQPLGTTSFCDWSNSVRAQTTTTAWTPLGFNLGNRPGPTAWPTPQRELFGTLATNTQYCVRVLARSDDDAQNAQVISNWSYVNGSNDPNAPAFTYAPPPATVSQPFTVFTPAVAYTLPINGITTPRTPLFTWSWLPGAKGYYVVISRDQSFTQVVDVGFTNVPAYAPRLANGEPLSDETTAYYWAVIPTGNPDGSFFNDAVLGTGSSGDNPQNFNKFSAAPAQSTPGAGTSVSTWPTFRWTAAENARNYTLQVAQDPSFGTLLDNVTTDATAYTSSSTYPADTTLYWRVRGNDWIGQGLNWSAVSTFSRHLPSSTPLGGARSGDGLAVWSWTGVPGAIAYDVHIDQGDGTTSDTTVDSTAFASTARHGLGTIHWQVRALFPTTNLGATVGGAFFNPQPDLLTLSAPAQARGTRSGARLVVQWAPDQAAKQYEVDVSTTPSFSTIVSQQRVDGPTWSPDINPVVLHPSRGTLYWRVAALDSYYTAGSFASGRFKSPPKHRRHK